MNIHDFTHVITHFPTWWKNSRPIALPQSLIPALAAVALSAMYSRQYNLEFNIPLAILAVIGVVFTHLSSNMLDDYFDHKRNRSDYRNVLAHKGMRARIAKCSYLLEENEKGEKNTMSQLFAAATIFALIAVVCGAIIFSVRGIETIYIALAAAFLGYTYSGSPLRLSYYGFGEVIIAIMFGPLLMLGVIFSITGAIPLNQFIFSIPCGLFVMNIIFTHSILDKVPDMEVGKKTLAGLINSNIGNIIISAICNFAPFVIILLAGLFGQISPLFLIVFLVLPSAISLFYLIIQFIYHPERNFEPKPFFGPITNWETYKQIGIDWFMLRWLMARNIISFAAVIMIIVAIITTIKV